MGGLLLEQPRATDGQCCTAVTKPRAALNGHQTVGRTQCTAAAEAVDVVVTMP